MTLLPEKIEFRWSIRKKGKHIFNMCQQLFLISAVMMGLTGVAHANPDGGVVTAGSATISSSGSQLEINQTSNNAVINWSSFNIAKGETTTFIQPGATSLAVNRITGGGISPTQILGNLHANGRIMILDPNGVFFGKTARVDVGGLLASTGKLDDANQDKLMNGRSFQLTDIDANPNSKIENAGNITAAEGGLAAFVAPWVSNSGFINASLGQVSLAAATKVTIDLTGDNLITIAAGDKLQQALLENKGAIAAQGGKVVISANAAKGIVDSVINMSGTVKANGFAQKDGKIYLYGGPGKVSVSGTLDASGSTGGGAIEVRGNDIEIKKTAVLKADATQDGDGGSAIVYADNSATIDGQISANAGRNGGDGGFIETSGDHVGISGSAKISTKASHGSTGQWLIDPTDYKIAASGGDITGAALSSSLNSTNVTILSSNGATAGSGDINVNDAISWTANNTLTLSAYRNVNINSNITATGNTAGLTLTPNTGAGGGVYTLNNGAAITLSGSTPSLNIAGVSYTVINNLTALQNMGTNLAGNYALGSNINATATSGWNSGAGFSPIGTVGGGLSFTGRFDGLNHTISNLYINRPTQNYAGLFGYATTGSNIRNIGFVGANITGQKFVGVLAGTAYGATINNSYATGTVYSAQGYVGGLIGEADDSNISNSHTTVTVGAASYYAGGLVGFLYQDSNSALSTSVSNSYASGNLSSTGNNVGGLIGTTQGNLTVSHSYATGSVTGMDVLGGFVGDNDTGTVTTDSYATGSVTSVSTTFGYYIGGFAGENNVAAITRCYAAGAVTGKQYVGGLVGQSDQGATITDSYATGSVSGNSRVGGLLGELNRSSTVNTSYSTGAVTGSSLTGGLLGNLLSGTVTNSYWNTQTSGRATSAAGTGLTTAQMQTQSSFTGFDFTNIWRIYEGHTFPLLKSLLTPLTITADNVTKAYSASTSEGLVNVTYSLASASGSPNLFSASAPYGSVTKYNVGTYTPVASGYWSNQQGYDITMAGGVLNVTPFALTVGATAASRVYDATTNAAVTLGDNHFAGDNIITGFGSASFADKNVGNGKTVNVTGITLSGTDAGNYTFNTAATATANITPLALTVGASGVNRVYDATTGATVTLSDNHISGDDVVASYGAASFANKKAGNNKAVSVTGITLSGADAGNYTSNTTASTTANITPFALTIDATGVNRVYDSTTNATVTLGDNRFAGDSLTLGFGSASFTDKNVGDGKTVNVSGLTLGGADASNYTFNTTATTTADITPFVLTIGASGVNRVYDGTTNATVNLSDNHFAGDTVTTDYGSASFLNKKAGNGKAVSVTGITLDGADAGNYSFNTTASATANITPFALTIAASGVDRVYNRTTGASVTFSDNRISGDTLTIAAGSANFTDKNVGNGKTVNVSGITLGGTDASNYTFNTTTSTTASITPFALTVAASGVNRVYNGTTAATVTLGDNRFAGDSLTTGFGSASFTDKNVGNGKTVNVSGITLGGADAGNYTFNTTATATANITPAALTVAASGVNRVYDGTTTATVTLSDNHIAGDTVTENYGAASFATKKVGTGKAISVTGITLGGADAGNYTYNTTAAATANVTPFALTIGATGIDRVYNHTTAASVALSDNRITGDSITIGVGSANFTDKNVGDGKTVNVSGLTLSGTDAANYTFNTTASTTANITPFALTIGAQGISRVYDGTTDATVALSDNRFAGDSFTLGLGSASFADKNVGDGKAVSVAGITLSGADAGNYTYNTTAATTASITPKALTFTGIPTAISKVYDGTITTGITGATLNGVVGTEDVNFAGVFLDKNAGRNKTISVTLGGGDAGNYSIAALKPLKGTITQAELDITATAADKIYDRTRDVTVTFSDNRVAGDDLNINANSVFSDKNAGVGKTVNINGVKLTGADAKNYTFDRTLKATASILPRSVTVTADDKTMTAGGRLPTLTYTVGGMGLAPLDNSNVAFTGKLSTPAGTAPPAGTYLITQGSLLANPNYVITLFTNGQLTVTVK